MAQVDLNAPKVGTFTLAMLTVAAVISLRNLPLFAMYGLSALFYLSLAAVLFLLPVALVTAELATGWPKAGGNYNWVKEAFGPRWGFLALWASWMESIAWFPAILAFIAHMAAYALKPWYPQLIHSLPFHLAAILGVFWATTWLNFKGVKGSGWLSTVGVLAGTLIPGVLIIILAGTWLLNHPAPLASFSDQTLIPSWEPDMWVLLGGVLLSYAGAELGAFHIADTKNPQVAYPRALLISVGLILTVSMLGALAIAMVVPKAELNLVAGLMQAYEIFLQAFGLAFWAPWVAALLVLGSLAGVNAWILGPAKGMLVTADDGFLPSWLQKTNQYGTPTRLLILQACIGSALALVFFFFDDSSVAYWVLTALATQFTVTQYALVFVAALKLRRSHAHVHRPFRVPGGSLGMVVICGSGLAICAFGLIIVFLAPAQLAPQNKASYAWILTACFVSLLAPALYLKPVSRIEARDT